jgi:hypothetical protein
MSFLTFSRPHKFHDRSLAVAAQLKAGTHSLTVALQQVFRAVEKPN